MISRPKPKSSLDYALEYYRLGLLPIPLCPTGESAKEPVRGLRWKRYNDTNERPQEKQIREWFTGKDRNIGIMLGEVSGGLVVRDFDTAEGYPEWANAYPDLAASLPTVKTLRGYHVYGRMLPSPPTMYVTDGELRGRGGYVVSPPSRHPDGPLYQWVVPFTELPPIVTPEQLFCRENAVKSNQGQKRGTEEDGRRRKSTDVVWGTIIAQKSIIAAIDRSVPNGPGQRNKQIFLLARRLLRATGGTVLSDQERKAIFDRWWEKAEPVVSTPDKALSLMEFLTACDAAHTPLDDAVEDAYERAIENPKPEWAVEYGEKVALLAGICRELERGKRDGEWYLSVRDAGKLIGCNKNEASNYFRLFARLRYLEPVEKFARGTLKATRYRYVADDL